MRNVIIRSLRYIANKLDNRPDISPRNINDVVDLLTYDGKYKCDLLFDIRKNDKPFRIYKNMYLVNVTDKSGNTVLTNALINIEQGE